MGQPHPKRGINDAGSAVFGDDMSSSSDSGEETKDEFNSNFDPLWECDDLAFFSFA